MAIHVRSERVGPLLYAAVRGTWTLRTAKRECRGLVEECGAQGLAMLLADCRSLVGAPTLTERYEFAESLAHHVLAEVHAGRLPPPRLAFLGHVPLIDPARFGEMVAVNRGIQAKATTELGEALQWLGVDPSILAGLEILTPSGG